MDTEAFRPRLHFTPPQNWMNDPNGLVFYEGEYHLFYQHNPYGTSWGHMSWGHAVSPDLVRWTHLPIAIYEAADGGRPGGGYTIFSGSAVIDRDNTSGFGQAGQPALVAIYTADYRGDPRLETIHIAYSLDRGRTFTMYAGNPVIDEHEAKFGDPKVFWHVPSRRWIMVNIFGHAQGYVILYASPDLKSWTRLSEFHAPDEAPGVWECPDLFPLRLDGDPGQTRWVLKVNCTRAAGEPAATRYFVGDFDGERFTNGVEVGRSMTSDDGAIYAEVTYNHQPDGRRILLGWLREQPREDRPWTGAQSLPRVLTLRSGPTGPELVQHPMVEVQALRGERQTSIVSQLAGARALEGVDLSTRALEVVATFAVPDAGGGATRCGLRLALSTGGEVEIGVDLAKGELFVVPGMADGEGPARIATAFVPRAGDATFTLRVFLDQAIVEAFAGESATVTTAAVTGFAPYGAAYTGLALFAEGGVVEVSQVEVSQADVWVLG